MLTTACKSEGNSSDKNKQNNEPKPFSQYLGNKISKDFIGSVTDDSKNPLENVTISIGNKTTITDINGNFKIIATNVNEHLAYLKVHKDNYRKYEQSIDPNANTKTIAIILNKESEPCLFWFCEHNHSLPNSSN